MYRLGLLFIKLSIFIHSYKIPNYYISKILILKYCTNFV